MRARNLVEHLSELFARIGAWSFDHRWVVLGVCLALLAWCTALAGSVLFDNSMEAYFDTADPSYGAYLDYRDTYGSDEISYILYSAPEKEHGPFDIEVMRKIQHLTEALETEVPFVDEVTSLANVEFVEGVSDGIDVYDLLDSFPQDQDALLAIRDKVMSKPLYVGGIISPDGRHAAIIIDMVLSSVDPIEDLRADPEGGDEMQNLYPQATFHPIEAILARPEYAGIEFHHVGDVPLNTMYNEIISGESGMLGGVSFAVIAVLLYAFFRRPIGVIGPLVVVLLSIMVSIGFVALMNWRLDLMFVMLPTVLIAIGVADAVHIVSEFRVFDAELSDRREAAIRTLYLVGPPCLLTSITTAAGFASMAVAPIKSIAHLAIYTAVGVVAAFLLSVTLLFVLLSLGRRQRRRPLSERQKRLAIGGPVFRRMIDGVVGFDIRYRVPIIWASVAVFAVSGLGISLLRVDSNFLSEFSPEQPIRKSIEHVDEVMGGMFSFVYLFDSGEPDGVKEPAVLRELTRLQDRAGERSDLVKKSYSVGDVLMDLNRSFHADDLAYQVLPDSRNLVAQYLLVYEMSGGDRVTNYVSSDFSTASLELRLKAVDMSYIQDLHEELAGFLSANPTEASEVRVTGMGALWLELMDYITQSQIRGFLVALAVIFGILCFIFGSFRVGLIAMVPNLSPVILTLGVMGWLDLPLDYTRLMIATVALGISVDDTIHLMTRFNLEFARRGSYKGALRASMAAVGRPLMITSAVLVAGFLAFLLSVMDSFATFGILLATTITVALVADFFLMPALVLTFEPFGPEREAAR